MSLAAEDKHSVVERLVACVDADPVLADHFEPGRMRASGRKVVLGGPDRVACVIARSVVVKPGASVAIALPRGTGPTPVWT